MALMISGSSDPALSQTATTLPNVTVDAPTVRPKPKQHAVARHAVNIQATTTVGTILAAPISDSAKLAKYASVTGSCVGGCSTSFKSGSAPWHGCSISSYPALSPTCRNVANFKTYEECRAASMLMGWRPNDIPWYCSSLALK
jgi:hypothetical protein